MASNMSVEELSAAQELRKKEKIQEMKNRFDAKIKYIIENKVGKNVKILTNVKYEEKISKLEEMRDPEYRMMPQDYALCRNYHIMNIINKDNLVVKTLVKVDPKTNRKKRYVTVEDLFDTIHEYHTKKIKHTGRLLTHKDLCLNFCNITMEQVIAYIDLCEVCAMKQGKAKKGVVVKPIISSTMGSRAQVSKYRYVVILN